MTELLENSDNTNESAVVSESPANEATISLAAVQALADALQKIEAYTPTVWVDNESPDIDAVHLNKAEQAIMRVTTAMNSAVDVIKDLQSQVNTTNNNLSKYWSLSGKATEIPDSSDMNTYITPGNFMCTTNNGVKTLKNCPVNNAFMLKVSSPISSKNYVMQEYIDLAGIQAIRTYSAYDKTWVEKRNATKDDIPTRYGNTGIVIPAGKSCKISAAMDAVFIALVCVQGKTGNGFGTFIISGYGFDGGTSRYRVQDLNISAVLSRITCVVGDGTFFTVNNGTNVSVYLVIEEFFNQGTFTYSII